MIFRFSSPTSLAVVCLMVWASTYLANCWVGGCVHIKIKALGSNILYPWWSTWCRLQRLSPGVYISRVSRGHRPHSFSTRDKVSLVVYHLQTHLAYRTLSNLGFPWSGLRCGGHKPIFSSLQGQFLHLTRTVPLCIFGNRVQPRPTPNICSGSFCTPTISRSSWGSPNWGCSWVTDLIS